MSLSPRPIDYRQWRKHPAPAVQRRHPRFAVRAAYLRLQRKQAPGRLLRRPFCWPTS